MNERRQRKLSGAVGVLLLGVVTVFLTIFGSAVLEEPLLLVQTVGLAVAGLLDVAAAVENPLNEYLAWYQLSGLGNVCIGCVFPLGMVDSAGTLDGGIVVLAIAAIGGLSLVVMGADMAAFHGKYTRGERLDT